MHDIDCNRVFSLLSEYLDHELPPATCEELEAHFVGLPRMRRVVPEPEAQHATLSPDRDISADAAPWPGSHGRSAPGLRRDAGQEAVLEIKQVQQPFQITSEYGRSRSVEK